MEKLLNLQVQNNPRIYKSVMTRPRENDRQNILRYKKLPNFKDHDMKIYYTKLLGGFKLTISNGWQKQSIESG